MSEYRPYQAHSETSQAAAESILPTAGSILGKVLRALRVSLTGRTNDELQVELGIGGSTIRPRVVDLVARGLVKDSGYKRPTRTGRDAVVWVAVVRREG